MTRQHRQILKDLQLKYKMEKYPTIPPHLIALDQWNDNSANADICVPEVPPTWLINNPFAKKCALIAVDEIIKSLRKSVGEVGMGTGYWSDVKQEIEKL